MTTRLLPAYSLLLIAIGAVPAVLGQGADDHQRMLAERVPSWDDQKQAYVQSQRGRRDLADALRKASESQNLAIAPDAADLLLKEALAAEAFHVRGTENRKQDLDTVHGRTALALADFLADLAGEAGARAELQPFSRYLAKRWGQGALGAPRRNVYGRLEVTVVPGSVIAEVWVDGRYVTTSDKRLVLVEGSHAVQTKDPARDRSCQETVGIAGGQTKRISCQLP